MTLDDDDTKMPIKDVKANPSGIANNWDQTASFGLRANLVKSQSLTIRVAKLAIDDMMPLTISQARSPPCIVFDFLTMGPTPPARTRAQIKKAMPAGGTKYALAVNKCRILWTGNQMAGREQSQKIKNDTKSGVLDTPGSKGPGIVVRSHDFQIERIIRYTQLPPM